MASKKDQTVVVDLDEGVELFIEPFDGELAVGDAIYQVIGGRVFVAPEHVEAASQAGFSPEPAAGHAVEDDGHIVASDHDAGGHRTQGIGGAPIAATQAEAEPTEAPDTQSEAVEGEAAPPAPAELTAADFAERV